MQVSPGLFRAEVPFYIFLWAVASWRAVVALGSVFNLPSLEAAHDRFFYFELLLWFLITPMFNLIKCVVLTKASCVHMTKFKLRHQHPQHDSIRVLN